MKLHILNHLAKATMQYELDASYFARCHGFEPLTHKTLKLFEFNTCNSF